MAEGHAVVRWARALAPLVGEPIVRIDVPRRWRERAAVLLGTRIRGIETRGKHLLLHCSSGDVIHGHAMQYGSWQVGETGMTPRKDLRVARLHIVTPAHEAIYYHGPVMEILSESELREHGALRALGPDIMSATFDAKEVARRVRAAGEREIGDVVLDQRVVAGIGNIYKSEGLFLARIDPCRPAGEIGAHALGRLWKTLGPLMHEGTRSFGAIATLPAGVSENGERNWVYRRRTRPCFVCGTPIEMVRQGELRRATYYCPSCQR